MSDKRLNADITAACIREGHNYSEADVDALAEGYELLRGENDILRQALTMIRDLTDWDDPGRSQFEQDVYCIAADALRGED